MTHQVGASEMDGPGFFLALVGQYSDHIDWNDNGTLDLNDLTSASFWRVPGCRNIDGVPAAGMDGGTWSDYPEWGYVLFNQGINLPEQPCLTDADCGPGGERTCGHCRVECLIAADCPSGQDCVSESWFKVQSPLPPDLVRAAHRMWHVPNAPDKSTFLVFGGLVGSVVQNELWRVVIHPTGSASYDRLPIPPPLPPPRGSFAGALDSAGLLLIFGGTQTGINSLGDTWTLDTNAIWPALEKAGLWGCSQILLHPRALASQVSRLPPRHCGPPLRE